MVHLGGGSRPSGPPIFVRGIPAGTGGGCGKKAAAMVVAAPLLLALLPVLIPVALYRKRKNKT